MPETGGRRGLTRESPQTPFNSGLRIIYSHFPRSLTNIQVGLWQLALLVFVVTLAGGAKFTELLGYTYMVYIYIFANISITYHYCLCSDHLVYLFV